MMTSKAIIITLSILFFSNLAFSQDNKSIKWYSWEDGYKIAKKENKILIVDLVTDNCPFCKKMEKSTYTNKKVVKTINESFVAVMFNPESAKNKDKTFSLNGKQLTSIQLLACLTNNSTLSNEPKIGYPTTSFLFTKDHEVYFETGYQDASIFKYMLKSCLKIQETK